MGEVTAVSQPTSKGPRSVRVVEAWLFTLQFVVNTLALGFALVVQTLAVATISRGDLAGHLDEAVSLLPAVVVFAAILTTVRWFVRPLIGIVFGRWVLRTFGVIWLLLDMAVMTLTIQITPLHLPFTAELWWSIPVTTVLFALFGFVITTFWGLNSPGPGDTRRYERAWRVLDRFSKSRRNWLREHLRQQEVLSIIASFAIDIVLAETWVGAGRRRVSGWIYGAPGPAAGLGRDGAIRVMLQRLGPAFVKFGQLASSQVETLPAGLVQELNRLQSDVPPVPFEAAREVFVAELGRAPEDVFAAFDPVAIAAASTAQVHRATLQDGTEVAVKIQRPNIVASVKADLGILQNILEFAEDLSSNVRRAGLGGVLDEFSAGVIDELDYRNESYHATRLREAMNGLEHVRVPRVFPELSSARILTMEFVTGVKVDQPGAVAATGIGGDELTEAFVRALVKQVFIDGFFHGDPHPGNILLDIDAGELVFLDLGLMGRLDGGRRFDLIDLLLSIQQKDASGLTTLLLRLTDAPVEAEVAQLRDDVQDFLNRYVRYASESTFGAMSGALFGLLQEHQLRLDPPFPMAIKTVAQAEAVTRSLGGDLDFVDFALHEVAALAVSEVTMDTVVEAAKQHGLGAAKQLLRELPDLEHAAGAWLQELKAGQLRLHLDFSELDAPVHALQHTLATLAGGFVLAGMTVAIAYVTVQVPQLWPVFAGLVLTSAGFVWRASRTTTRGRRRRTR